MSATTSASPELVRLVVKRFGLILLVMMLMFFVPAGTWRYWEAWVYMVVLCVPLVFAVSYLFRYAPDLLERRMRFRERETQQRRIVAASWIPFILAFVVPGLDFRFGWSHIPIPVIVIADALVLVGYLFVILVFRENRYASRVIEVDKEQQVISTGPYSVVRHPMYLGAMVMYLASPIALGSYWAALFALPLIWVFVARIRNEEQVLLRDLPGYGEYIQRVRYRLIPVVW
jgi:protein-S-isoprenylcysteine O-methyltransferase Ste14